jgi:hypothetical protein
VLRASCEVIFHIARMNKSIYRAKHLLSIQETLGLIPITKNKIKLHPQLPKHSWKTTTEIASQYWVNK